MQYFQLISFLAPALLWATKTVAQTQSKTGIPQFSTGFSGITLPVTAGSNFTSVSGQWNFQGDLEDNGSSPTFFTQFVAMDFLPTPDNFAHGFPPPLPLPPVCSNFLEVGTNITVTFAFLFAPPVTRGFAYYIWNGVEHNITDNNGNPLSFVAGETVTVTINANVDGNGATFTYDSNIHGAIEVLLEGNLCLRDVSWGIGSPTEIPPPFFPSTAFIDSSATSVNTQTFDISTFGPVAGVETDLASAGGTQLTFLANIGATGFDVSQSFENGGY